MEQPELIMTKITKQYRTRDVPLLLVFFPLVSWYSQWNLLCHDSENFTHNQPNL